MVQVGLSNTDQIWTVFKHCMVEHVDLLMPNRHLDHIILCSLYAICKVRAPEHLHKPPAAAKPRAKMLGALTDH